MRRFIAEGLVGFGSCWRTFAIFAKRLVCLLIGRARDRLWRLVGELCCGYTGDIKGCAFDES